MLTDNKINLMSTIVQSFAFQSNNVRVIEIDNDPWFVLGDVLGAIASSTKVNDATTTINEALGDGWVNNSPIVDKK